MFANREGIPGGFTSRARIIGLCLLGLAISAFLFGPALEITLLGRNDFMNFYSGAHLAFTDSMYDVPSNLHVMREAAGWDNVNRLFNRPPFYALLLWPLGRLPFLAASHVWEILIIATIAAFCFLWPGDRKVTTLVCCWSFPLFHVFANGQDVAILLVLIALAVRAMRKGQDTLAGILLSVCSIKFHLFLLLPILILGQRRWRLLGGVMGGGVVLAMVSFLSGGWDWPVKYIRLLLNPIGNPWPDRMPSIHGISSSLPQSGIWEVLGTIAVVLLVWQAVRRGNFEYGLAAVLVGGILLAPHVFLSDCAMTVPALLITMPLATVAWQRRFHLFLVSPIGFIWALLGPAWITGVVLILYLVSIAAGRVFVRSPLKSIDTACPVTP
jgi:hypothetical protein